MKFNPVPVDEPPVELIVVELKLDGEVDGNDVGGLGLELLGHLGVGGVGLSRDEGEGGEGGPGKVLAVLGVRKSSKQFLEAQLGMNLQAHLKYVIKNLFSDSEELGYARLIRETAEGGAW